MESPHLYEEYKKDASIKLKSYNDVNDDYINSELGSSEVSLNLQHLIEDQPNIMSDALIADLQGLNVDKASLAGVNCPRGLGANPSMGCLPQSLSASNMYNTLPYVPQAAHGGSQYDRSYGDRIPIKEEPYDNSPDASHEYASCARMNYSGYGYPLSSPVVPNSDPNLLKNPHKAHTTMVKAGQKKMTTRTDDEYRKRRERNNIAVRKSREKAKLRTRETEERVKILTEENRSLRERCKSMGEELNLFKHFFQTMNMDGIPESLQLDIKNIVEKDYSIYIPNEKSEEDSDVYSDEETSFGSAETPITNNNNYYSSRNINFNTSNESNNEEYFLTAHPQIPSESIDHTQYKQNHWTP